MTIISQYAEGNHYNAVNGKLLFWGVKLLVFIFLCYQVINKTKFFKTNSLKQCEFGSLIKILQIILLEFLFDILLIHLFMYLFLLEGMQTQLQSMRNFDATLPQCKKFP